MATKKKADETPVEEVVVDEEVEITATDSVEDVAEESVEETKPKKKTTRRKKKVAKEETPCLCDKYDETYFIDAYKEQNGHAYEHSPVWEKFFGVVAQRLINTFNPGTVLDAGCAVGVLVAAFNKRTGINAIGYDFSEWAITNAPENVRDSLVQHDLTKPFPTRGFDLVTCIEVLEHIAEGDIDDAVRNLCASVNDGGHIVFSSTPGDTDNEYHEVSLTKDAWLKKFRSNGFVEATEYNVGFITPHAFVLRGEQNKRFEFFCIKISSTQSSWRCLVVW